MQEVDVMTKEELVATGITRYMDLLRVKQAAPERGGSLISKRSLKQRLASPRIMCNNTHD